VIERRFPPPWTLEKSFKSVSSSTRPTAKPSATSTLLCSSVEQAALRGLEPLGGTLARQAMALDHTPDRRRIGFFRVMADRPGLVIFILAALSAATAVHLRP
jgi:hypothetical protein